MNYSYFLAEAKNPLRLISDTHAQNEALIKYRILLNHTKFSDVCLLLITSTQAPELVL